MEEKEENFNKIHQFLRQELSIEERKTFENEVNKNPVLMKAVATQRRIKVGLKVNNYKAQFKAIHTKLQNENALPDLEFENYQSEAKIIKVSSNKSFVKYSALAASIILLIGVGLFLFTKKETNEQLAKQNTFIKGRDKDEKNIITPIDKQSKEQLTKKDIPKKGLDFQKEFAQNFDSIPKIESPFNTEKFGVSPTKINAWEADTLLLRKGISLLVVRQTKAAIEILRKSENSHFKEIKSQSAWYLALAYLQENNKDFLRKQLEKNIANKDLLYTEKSRKLFERIK